MNAIILHPFRALIFAVFLASNVGQPVLAQVNDDFVDRIVLGSILPVSGSGSNVGASVETDEPAHAGDSPESSVWWEWTAPSSGTVQIDPSGSDNHAELAVYTGESLTTLSEIASNDDKWGVFTEPEVRFSAVKGTTYQIAVGTTFEGNIELTISMLPGPHNDNFADRIVLPSVLPTSAGGSNVNASAEFNEPDHAGGDAETSVWWEWTAPASGTVQIDTFGSDFDTELAIYAGTNLATLSEIASNDDWVRVTEWETDEYRSRVRVSVAKGVTYQIAVDGGFRSEGNIALTISMAPPGPPNDNFEDRIALPSVLPTSTSGSNVGATSEFDEPAHAGNSPGSSVWWMWTAPSSGTVQIHASGNGFGTELAVYSGMTLATLREIASDGGFGFGSRVRFLATMGTTYQIAIDSDENRRGRLSLEIGTASSPSVIP